MVEHREQVARMRQRLGDALVQGPVAGDGTEQVVEPRPHPRGLRGGRLAAVGQQGGIEGPVQRAEDGPQLLVLPGQRDQAFVVAGIVDSAQGMLLGNPHKLAGLIAEQYLQDRHLSLVVIGGNGQGIEDPAPRLRAQVPEVRVEQVPHLDGGQQRVCGRHTVRAPRTRALTPTPSSQAIARASQRYCPSWPGRSRSTMASRSLRAVVW